MESPALACSRLAYPLQLSTIVSDTTNSSKTHRSASMQSIVGIRDELTCSPGSTHTESPRQQTRRDTDGKCKRPLWFSSPYSRSCRLAQRTAPPCSMNERNPSRARRSQTGSPTAIRGLVFHAHQCAQSDIPGSRPGAWPPLDTPYPARAAKNLPQLNRRPTPCWSSLPTSCQTFVCGTARPL
jgi:hypothetical protein